MRVSVPSPLRSYTSGREEVEARGATLGDLLVDLDGQFPGMRFRMIDEQDRVRPHIRFFVNQALVRELGAALAVSDRVQILCALSGG
jgi:molybdopterin converting factor small subunit